MNKVEKVEMLKAGVHFGHRTSKWNPKMEPFIFTNRQGVHIIDLDKTEEYLNRALEFVAQIAAKGGTVLFVASKRQAKDLVKKAAEDCNMPYVTERWLGGTFTNFLTISKRTRKLRDLEAAERTGELKKYTKKEQLVKKEEIKKLNHFMGGIKNMTSLPDAVFLIDVIKEKVAVSEIKKAKVPLIALIDTNADPAIAEYPIPSNDDAIKVIELMVNAVRDAVKDNFKTPIVKNDNQPNKK
ncbi:MAG: 30S ribosomal protein S2 [bacterium]